MKIPGSLFLFLCFIVKDKLIITFLWKHKGIGTVKAILIQKNKIKIFKLLDFKAHYKAVIIKTM